MYDKQSLLCLTCDNGSHRSFMLFQWSGLNFFVVAWKSWRLDSVYLWSFAGVLRACKVSHNVYLFLTRLQLSLILAHCGKHCSKIRWCLFSCWCWVSSCSTRRPRRSSTELGRNLMNRLNDQRISVLGWLGLGYFDGLCVGKGSLPWIGKAIHPDLRWNWHLVIVGHGFHVQEEPTELRESHTGRFD